MEKLETQTYSCPFHIPRRNFMGVIFYQFLQIRTTKNNRRHGRNEFPKYLKRKKKKTSEPSSETKSITISSSLILIRGGGRGLIMPLSATYRTKSKLLSKLVKALSLIYHYFSSTLPHEHSLPVL